MGLQTRVAVSALQWLWGLNSCPQPCTSTLYPKLALSSVTAFLFVFRFIFIILN